MATSIDDLRRMMLSVALMGAGGRMMSASQGVPGQPGPTLGGVLGTGVQGFAQSMGQYAGMMPQLMKMQQEQQRRARIQQLTAGLPERQKLMAEIAPKQFVAGQFKASKTLSPRDLAFSKLSPEEQRQVLMKPAVQVDTGERIDYQRKLLGMKREFKLEASYPKAKIAMETANAQHDVILRNIDRALGQSSAWTTGLGSLTAVIPGTPAADLRSTLDTIKANMAMEALASMREGSATGASGLGALSENERRMLESKVAALEQSQSKSQFETNLRDLRRSMLLARGKRKQAFTSEYKKQIGSVPKAAAPKTTGGWKIE